jgi:hypothetical protein
MEIIDKGGGKHQILNHAGELMFQGTYEQCLDIQQRMIKMSSYEGEYMDIIRNKK